MPEVDGRDAHGGIITVDEIRHVGGNLLAGRERAQVSRFEDMVIDTIAGIAHGRAEDPVSMCRELCVIGAAVYKDPDAWLTWEGAKALPDDLNRTSE